MADVLIELKGICFSYEDGPPLFDGLALAIESGETMIVNGPNGSGKSTLLQIIVGLLIPSAGEVRLFGQTCRREASFREARRRVGFLFQDSDDQLFCPTVLEDIAFGPLNYGHGRKASKELAMRALEMVGLPDFAGRITHKLSGGEKRLVALATVLALEPEVLLLDEPTNGLDPENETRILDLLKNLPQAKVLVSHDPILLNTFPKRRYHIAAKRLAPLREAGYG